MNLGSWAVVLSVAADAWLLAYLVIRGRRPWIQATFAACALAFIVQGAAAVGSAEGVLSTERQDIVLGPMVLAHALMVILVLSLIHGETLPRRRAAAFLLLVPVPVLALLAPSQRWSAANAYEGSALGGFLVLCFGLALAEAIYARYTSRLLAGQAFWLSLGVIALIVAGPVYTYELELLGQPLLAGANFASPIALACFAWAAHQADPFPGLPKGSRGPSAPGSIRGGDVIVFEEARPKYALRTANAESSAGRAVLVLGRTPPSMTASGAGFASVVPSHAAALRSLTTASEFLAASPGGLVVLEGLADLSALSGWRPTQEAIVRLRHVARDTRSTIVLATTKLTNAERLSLRDLHWTWWTLPDPATEIGAILAQSFGTGAPRLVESFCRAHGLRPDAITADHVPALLVFLQRALAELSGVVEGTAAHGLRVQYEAAASVLRSFATQGAEELARGKWPSRRSAEAGAEWVVTAADYWKGKEMEELFAAADTVSDRESLFEKARAVFVEQLGDAGESVLRSQLTRLGKRPEDIERADLVRIADRASVDLGTLADVVDLPEEKDRIQKQIASIRERLELLVEGEE